MKYLLILFFVMPINSICFSQIAYDLLIGNDLKGDANEVIEGFYERANRLMNRVDLISKNRIQELLLGLNSFKYFIRNERIKTIGDLDRIQQDALRRIDRILANISDDNQIEGLSALLSANFQTAMNNIPFSSKQYLVYRIDGVSLKYQDKDLYKIRVTANLPDKKFDVKFRIDNSEFASKLTGSTNIREIEIEADYINSLFKDTKLVELSFQIEVTKKRLFRTDTIINHLTTINLLPKFPIQYELNQVVKTTKLSEPILTRKEEIISRLQTKTITYTPEDGCKLDRDSTKLYNSKEDFFLKNPVYNCVPRCPNLSPHDCADCQARSNALYSRWPKLVESTPSSPNPIFTEGRVQATYYSSWDPGDVTIYLIGACRKEVDDIPESRPIKFVHDKDGFLKYGYYETDFLDSNFIMYELKIKYFYSNNWDRVSPKEDNVDGIQVDILSPQPEYRKISIQIDKNY